MKKMDNERGIFLRDPCEGEFPDRGFLRLWKKQEE